MRVAYVSADAGVPVFGSKGCSIHVQEIIRSFLRRGDSVELFTTCASGLESPSDFKNCNVHYVPVPASMQTGEREQRLQEAAKRIAIEVDRLEIDLIYERYSLWSAAVMRSASVRGIPSILEVNAPLIQEQMQHRKLEDISTAKKVCKNAFQYASTIIAVSEGVASYIRSQLVNGSDSKVHVVPNGVDVIRFAPTIAPERGRSEFTIGFLGTLKPWHGIESLLDAFSIVRETLPTARLCIVGDGPMRTQLESMVQTRSPHMGERIDWVGSVSPQQVPNYLNTMDVAVAPYLDLPDFYFSPLKVYEYMASGRAVVASSIGQLKTLINDRVNGRLFPAGDASSMAQIFLELANDRNERIRLGRAARATVVKDHSWQKTLSTILEHSTTDRMNSTSFHESSLASSQDCYELLPFASEDMR